jgi:hypothetical protein
MNEEDPRLIDPRRDDAVNLPFRFRRAIAATTAVSGFPSGAANSLAGHVRTGRLVEAFLLLVHVGQQRWLALPAFWSALVEATTLLGVQETAGYAEARDRCIELARRQPGTRRWLDTGVLVDSDLGYGKLDQVTLPAEILDSAAADPTSSAWDLLWRASGQQGTGDPASAVLLPWLVQTCTAFAGEDREKALVLAGMIALGSGDDDRATYTDEIAALRALAVDGLPKASSDSTFVYLQQAILGFDGDEIWGKELDHLNDGEVDVRCPGCEEELLVNLRDEGSEIEPGLHSELAGRLHAEAVAAGRESVATGLTHLFGRLNCPGCGTRFVLADHVAGV